MEQKMKSKIIFINNFCIYVRQWQGVIHLQPYSAHTQLNHYIRLLLLIYQKSLTREELLRRRDDYDITIRS